MNKKISIGNDQEVRKQIVENNQPVQPQATLNVKSFSFSQRERESKLNTNVNSANIAKNVKSRIKIEELNSLYE